MHKIIFANCSCSNHVLTYGKWAVWPPSFSQKSLRGFCYLCHRGCQRPYTQCPQHNCINATAGPSEKVASTTPNACSIHHTFVKLATQTQAKLPIDHSLYACYIFFRNNFGYLRKSSQLALFGSYTLNYTGRWIMFKCKINVAITAYHSTYPNAVFWSPLFSPSFV